MTTMWSDVVDLRDFYQGALGQAARRMIRRRIQAIWPDTHGCRVLGLGFATPYLRPFLADSERVAAVMPPAQGVLRWPYEGPGVVCLADEASLPLPDRSIDRAIIVHALESTEQVRAMLREVWRVLADGGRLLIVAPNRRGIWAQLDRTPFGQGQPYTASQLNRLLRDNMYTPMQTAAALFMPPFRSRFVLRSATAWEQVGARWFPTFAGVLIVEASKQIYAGTALSKESEQARPYAVVPQGFPRVGGRSQRPGPL
jgi:SAM-dependent methyltransferase